MTGLAHEAELIAAAKALREQEPDIPWAHMAAKLGVSTNTLKRHLIPGYAEWRNARKRKKKRLLGKRISDTELRRLRQSRPPDKRDLTNILMGDPRTGRSALDRRGEGNEQRG